MTAPITPISAFGLSWPLRVVSVGILLWVAACASEAPPPAAGPAPRPDLLTLLPVVELNDPLETKAVADAVTAIESTWPPGEGDPLRHPASNDDVLKILKLDQTNLFAAAIDRCRHTPGTDAQVLQ